METEAWRCRNHTRVYQVTKEPDPEIGTMVAKRLIRIELDDGFLLWEIVASYAKSRPPVSYYVIAKNKIAAISQFQIIAPWLDHIDQVKLPSEEHTNWILNNPAHYIIW